MADQELKLELEKYFNGIYEGKKDGLKIVFPIVKFLCEADKGNWVTSQKLEEYLTKNYPKWNSSKANLSQLWSQKITDTNEGAVLLKKLIRFKFRDRNSQDEDDSQIKDPKKGDIKTSYTLIESVKEVVKDFIKNSDYDVMGLIDGKQVSSPPFIGPLNIILYGPPGTGKTYNTINRALEIIGKDLNGSKERKPIKDLFDDKLKDGQIVFTTFHQSMTYEDFIEGIKPLPPEENEPVKYDVVDGIFKKLCDKASKDTGKKNYVLIIDEINRGNVSQIFGELITLIEEDKRSGKEEFLSVTLPYSNSKDKGPFSVPSNLYIIGTMNTADRSVEALDAALRRRFSFEEMPPKPVIIAEEGQLKDSKGILDGVSLPELLSTINSRIEKLLDKDHQIGHSYFMSVENEQDLYNAFTNKIIPLLQEYFFGDYGKIGLVLGKEFVKKKSDNITFAAFDYDDSVSQFESRVVYEILDINKNEFIRRVKTILSNEPK